MILYILLRFERVQFNSFLYSLYTKYLVLQEDQYAAYFINWSALRRQYGYFLTNQNGCCFCLVVIIIIITIIIGAEAIYTCFVMATSALCLTMTKQPSKMLHR